MRNSDSLREKKKPRMKSERKLKIGIKERPLRVAHSIKANYFPSISTWKFELDDLLQTHFLLIMAIILEF